MEESIRLALVEFVADAGEVDVQRMRYDWKENDVLIQLHLHKPISGLTLLYFRREIAAILRKVVTDGDPLQEWLVVIDHAGEKIGRVAPSTNLDDIADD
ncbi:hypothetical protein SAMN05216350_106157 [Polaromonas sp. YR568]|uniref:hypothetical protein n=1 Tax=Polaromonas sp. YR568 TaxID=1855301 RepID=UPI0008E9799A|nr:hypothetical protein [Polaromonas sp. YR568]SFU84828.1 hypothetical protein SAMN05216350_106157 [Polaromonas sp. YR568]